jgi:hypothetical protein
MLEQKKKRETVARRASDYATVQPEYPRLVFLKGSWRFAVQT